MRSSAEEQERNVPRRHLASVLIACCAMTSICASAAEAYPERPIRFIVPFPPGGGTDVLARLLGTKLTELWAQQVIIDNRSGAQGNIGTALGARAAADGHTITLAHQGALVINPHLYKETGFDTLRDFTAVSRGTATPSILVVHPSVPAKTMRELAQVAKQNPGKLTFGSTASAQHLMGEFFKLTTATQMVHVPYKGAGPAVIDLLAGNINLMFANPTSTIPQVKAGKLRALAILGSTRNEAVPDVPTALEAGFPELGEMVGWYGVIVPAATPRAIVEKLNAAIVRALTSPDLAKRIVDSGQFPSPSTQEEFSAQIRKEFQRYGKVVQVSGAKID